MTAGAVSVSRSLAWRTALGVAPAAISVRQQLWMRYACAGGRLPLLCSEEWIVSGSAGSIADVLPDTVHCVLASAQQASTC